MQLVDAKGAALFLPDDAMLEAQLAGVLRNRKLEAVLGDVVLDGALPTLIPLAAVVRSANGLALDSIGGVDTTALLASRKVKAVAKVASSGASRWAEAARRAGASTAAIALGEVREEMAHALATGLPSAGRRFADPLVARLRDLGLSKQAELLASIADRPEAEAKLDDFVKLHQVLGIALARLAGATHVDRSTLEPVPTFESVFVKTAERELSPDEVAREHGAGRLNRYEAAAHYARHYEALDPDALAASIYPTWADGSAAPYIVRAFTRHPAQAIAAATRALGVGAEDPKRPS
jgi:hypothetical protein